MKSPDEIITFVKAGEVTRLDYHNKTQLAAQLNKDEACVVFYAYYNNHEGFVSKDPTVMMLHWSKIWNGDPKTRLARLLSKVPDEGSGMGFLHKINVYIVTHPENSAEITAEVKTAIANISKELFLNEAYKSDIAENLRNINNQTDVNKIPVHSFETFKVNAFGQAVSIAVPQKQDKARVKDDKTKFKLPNPFRKFV